jgi:hypothetical protein
MTGLGQKERRFLPLLATIAQAKRRKIIRRRSF